MHHPVSVWRHRFQRRAQAWESPPGAVAGTAANAPAQAESMFCRGLCLPADQATAQRYIGYLRGRQFPEIERVADPSMQYVTLGLAVTSVVLTLSALVLGIRCMADHHTFDSTVWRLCIGRAIRPMDCCDLSPSGGNYLYSPPLSIRASSHAMIFLVGSGDVSRPCTTARSPS